MKIYPDNARQFKGQTTYTLWDHEESGGYGHFSERQEALDAAYHVMTHKGYYGVFVDGRIEPIPYMLLVAVVPSKTLGYYEQVLERLAL